MDSANGERGIAKYLTGKQDYFHVRQPDSSSLLIVFYSYFPSYLQVGQSNLNSKHSKSQDHEIG